MRWDVLVARIGQTRNTYNSSLEKLEERVHLENTGVDGRTILHLYSTKAYEDVNWIYLPEFMDQGRALVSIAMKLRVP
jgi:hypothetical protein